MRRTIAALLGCGLLVAGLTSAAQAQPFRGLQGRLDLSDEQKAQLEDLQKQHREAAREARAEIIIAQAEIQALMLDPERDLGALERAMKAKSDLDIGERIRALRNQQEYRAVLSEEQQAKLANLQRNAVARGVQQRRATPRHGARGRGRAGVRGRSSREFGRSGRASGRTSVRGRGRGIPPQASPLRGFNRRGVDRPPMQDREVLQKLFQRRMRTRRGQAVPPPTADNR